MQYVFCLSEIFNLQESPETGTEIARLPETLYFFAVVHKPLLHPEHHQKFVMQI